VNYFSFFFHFSLIGINFTFTNHTASRETTLSTMAASISICSNRLLLQYHSSEEGKDNRGSSMHCTKNDCEQVQSSPIYTTSCDTRTMLPPPPVVNAQQSFQSHQITIDSPFITKSDKKRFQTKLALRLSTCSLVMLFLMAVFFSEWNVLYHPASSNLEVDQYSKLDALERNDALTFLSDQRGGVVRRLDDNQDAADNNNNAEDYSSERCDEIFTKTTNAKSSYTEPSQRCLYARTCDEGEGLLLPFVFCHTTILSTSAWFILISPILLLGLAVLFRLLGSTAEDYFSPSLEMFSLKLGLPPRFAGVTLLALGNGAADVSATMNAISSDPENGYKMSLGALSGAAMFIVSCSSIDRFCRFAQTLTKLLTPDDSGGRCGNYGQ